MQKLDELKVPVLLETKATKILANDKGAVCGVVAEDKDGKEMTISCTAVILATGGPGMVKAAYSSGTACRRRRFRQYTCHY